MVDYIADYLENIRDRRVFPDVTPGYMKKLVPDEMPLEGEEFKDIFKDVDRVIMPVTRTVGEILEAELGEESYVLARDVSIAGPQLLGTRQRHRQRRVPGRDRLDVDVGVVFERHLDRDRLQLIGGDGAVVARRPDGDTLARSGGHDLRWHLDVEWPEQ